MTDRKFKKLKRVFPVFEAILLVFGYYFLTTLTLHLKDPFFVKNSINPFVLLLVILTLFHGLTVGILSVVLLIPLLERSYSEFPATFFLWTLLIVLISGEFHYFWNKKIKLLTEEVNYLKGKLRNQMSNFILLKLSHDQLEKHYLLKPISLRSLLTKIKKTLPENRGKATELFLDTLINAFFVESGAIFSYKNGNFLPEFHLGNPVELFTEDPLLREALEKEETVFISSLPEESTSHYLAVIPIKDLSRESGLSGVFLLKKMPFNYLNADHILALSVAVNWFFNQLQEEVDFSKLPEKVKKILSYDFLRELLILKKLNDEAGIESSLVIFRVPDVHTDFPFFLEKRVRGMDTVDWTKQGGAIYSFVLLPLSSIESAEGFINRVKDEIEKVFKEEIDYIYRVFPVDRKIFQRLDYVVR